MLAQWLADGRLVARRAAPRAYDIGEALGAAVEAARARAPRAPSEEDAAAEASCCVAGPAREVARVLVGSRPLKHRRAHAGRSTRASASCFEAHRRCPRRSASRPSSRRRRPPPPRRPRNRPVRPRASCGEIGGARAGPASARESSQGRAARSRRRSRPVAGSLARDRRRRRRGAAQCPPRCGRWRIARTAGLALAPRLGDRPSSPSP